MKEKPKLKSLSDEELLDRLSEQLGESRRVEAQVVAHIGEVDARKLYRREACPSMFAYCTQVLNLSEPESYERIKLARAAQTIRAPRPPTGVRRSRKRKG